MPHRVILAYRCQTLDPTLPQEIRGVRIVLVEHGKRIVAQLRPVLFGERHDGLDIERVPDYATARQRLH